MLKRILMAAALGFVALPAQAFERDVVDALTVCHDYLWNVPQFADLPRAAITVFPGVWDDNSILVFWNITWDEPIVRAAGNCTIIGGELQGFEDYTAEE